ncbi:ADP-glyceromanno-heptose 6-epimerase [Fusobacterium necrophorum]|uniref:ADP-glyceromanno-heptose 6-epimerase n=1 Tax=Fusobacterium necrophorum TaxID=859 RepID=UPI000786F789|nr:ADP-glyceromanno-heptose 6-epimerase [Fusobacterium necrophorum]KYM43797.1 ADP-L-glycero-D-mannoheptose-6-epimerase [Fusobacterium necrophorum subsp. funduliforme]
MIVVTGAAGMIGSAVVWKLNEMGIHDILLVDKLRNEDKWLNIRKRDYRDWMDRDFFLDWLFQDAEANEITAIVHMGACSATTETDGDYLMENNYGYTKTLWDYCSQRNIRFIYASSAATYGAGEKGYNDEVGPEELKSLQPLNKYGYSKKRFDDWVFKQKTQPRVWAGLKFFNVYGPQEYHKGRMASMVFHSFRQYKETGKVKLFQSHKEGYEDGGQLRDFVYLKDVVDIIYYMLTQDFSSGIYNIGTGEARSFLDLAMATIRTASGKEDIQVSDVIEFIPMPEDLRGKYQYFTQATMEKLAKTSYHLHMHSLEEGIKDYVQNYLSQEDAYL